MTLRRSAVRVCTGPFDKVFLIAIIKLILIKIKIKTRFYEKKENPKMKKGGALGTIAVVLLIIGGLNWGLVGLFQLDLVDLILGSVPVLASVVYVLIGLAAIVKIIMLVSKDNK